MGSKSDLAFAKRLDDFLVQEGFPLRCEFNVASAHKTPDILLRKTEGCKKSGYRE